jgi:hypothetical protein
MFVFIIFKKLNFKLLFILQIKKPNTQARLSGVHVFGLNIQELKKERERKQNSHLLKPFNRLSNSMKTK